MPYAVPGRFGNSNPLKKDKSNFSVSTLEQEIIEVTQRPERAEFSVIQREAGGISRRGNSLPLSTDMLGDQNERARLGPEGMRRALLAAPNLKYYNRS